MKQKLLETVISKEEAVKALSGHLENWLAKFIYKQKRLKSIERVYLPYFCFPYHLDSRSLNGEIEGRIAIETYERISAILPVNHPLLEIDEHSALLPFKKWISKEQAYDAVYWDLFHKEKDRKTISLVIEEPFLIYVPYWIGYLQGKEYDILPLDAVTGQVDLKIKPSLLQAFLQAEQVKGMY